jgi:hypothetical protein
MNNKLILSPLVITAFLFSCKKNSSTEGNPPAIIDSSTIVEKGILKQLRINELNFLGVPSPYEDSIHYNFSYNAQKNIKNINVILKQGFATGNNNFSYTRNIDEIVTNWTLTPSNQKGKVYYNTAIKNYSAYTDQISYVGLDSVAIKYTGNHLTELLKYCTKCTGGPNALGNRSVLTYDAAGNLKQFLEYSGGAINPNLVSREEYEYDNKKNPLQISPEILFLTESNFWGSNYNDVFFGPNNVTKKSYYSLIDSTQNNVTEYNYTYNNSMYPTKAICKKNGKNHSEINYVY